MNYLHDFTTARKTLEEDIIPMMVAALMPTMDKLKYRYRFNESALFVTLPDGELPDGYVMRISFAPVSTAPWKAPDGTPTKGPGF